MLVDSVTPTLLFWKDTQPFVPSLHRKTCRAPPAYPHLLLMLILRRKQSTTVGTCSHCSHAKEMSYGPITAKSPPKERGTHTVNQDLAFADTVDSLETDDIPKYVP